MLPFQVPTDCTINGTLSCKAFTPPANCITPVAIPTGSAGNYVKASSVNQQWSLDYNVATGTTVVAASPVMHVVKGANASVYDLAAVVTGTVATGADRTVTVDLQRSTAGGAFATVMTSTVILDHTATLRVAQRGAVNPSLANLVAGDLLQFVITVAGAAGAQAAGLTVTATIIEEPQ